MNFIQVESLLQDIVQESSPLADMCGCSECGWKGKVSDCESEWESEGWEYPSYMIHLCPKCEEGGVVDDYWYSDELIAEMDKNKLTTF